MTGPDQKSDQDEVQMREAAQWFARMRAPDAEGSRAGFDAWLAIPENREAYNRVAEVFALGKILGGGQHGGESAGDRLPETAAGNETPRGTKAGSPAAAGRKKRMLAGVAALAAVAAIAALASRSMLEPPAPGPDQVAASTAAEQLLSTSGTPETLRLADGSSIALAPDTRVRTILTADRRLLKLERGRARFHVFHGRRPFMVAAGGGTVTARGTVFDVALVGSDSVAVRLISGKVDVSLPQPGPLTEPRRKVVQLSPGDAVTFARARDTAAESPHSRSGHPAGPQSHGPIREFESVRVADIVAEANRLSTQPIRLSSAGLGEARISGRFRTDDTALLAERLSLLFDLAIDRSDPSQIVLRMR